VSVKGSQQLVRGESSSVRVFALWW
jgi:hypothetical protein